LRSLGPSQLLVAEIGTNHGGDPSLAEAMILAAAGSGADAVKLQAYQAESFLHPESPYFDELKAEELPFEAISRLVAEARRRGLLAGLTVFGPEGLELAERCRADFVKISSGDLTYLSLLKVAAKSPRRLMLSTGASCEAEMRRALMMAPKAVILQCASLYPAPPEAVNLAVLDRWLSEGLEAGLSDHSLTIEASVWALRMGARVVERHFTVDRSLPGGDNAISSLPEDFRALREAAKLGPLTKKERLDLASRPFWGDPVKRAQPGEDPLLIRRALVALRDLAPGERAGPPGAAWLRPPGRLNSAPFGPGREEAPMLSKSVPKGTVILESDLDL
jgi:sialic acid synthase SpsE